MLSGQVQSATAAAGAATLNSQIGVVTSEALTTAAGSDYTLTLTNSYVASGSVVLVSVGNGTNTTLYAVAHSIAPAAGSVVIKVRNAHGSAALNGTLVISFVVL
jgi:hypothetical protein